MTPYFVRISALDRPLRGPEKRIEADMRFAAASKAEAYWIGVAAFDRRYSTLAFHGRLSAYAGMVSRHTLSSDTC